MTDTPLAGLTVAVFGLGEAGGEIAADLAAAGAAVTGYDPDEVPDPPGVRRTTDAAVAVTGVDLVLAITASADAPGALAQALGAIPSGAVYADLATASAGTKRDLAATAAASGLAFADVALMSTVPGKGLRTPSLVSGPGAARYAELLEPCALPVEVVGDEPGVAATRKLLRSVVLKGFAALLIESLRAAEAAGLAEETWANLVAQFSDVDEDFLRRMVEGTDTHAVRRLHEMEATVQLLEELGTDPVMTTGTVESLQRAVRHGVEPPPA